MDIRTPIPTNYGDWPARWKDVWRSQAKALEERFGAGIERVLFPEEHPTDVPVVYVRVGEIIEVLKFMKEESGFEYGFLSDITGTDEMPQEPRFEVVYNLLSHATRTRIRVKVRVKEGEEVPTATGLWKGADWAEREIFDMFGVRFRGHPDLRRILMDVRWEGHPLRKDYPVKGYQLFPTAEPVDPRLLD